MPSGKYDLEAAGKLLGRVRSAGPPASEAEKTAAAQVLLDELEELLKGRGFTVDRTKTTELSALPKQGDGVTVYYGEHGFSWLVHRRHAFPAAIPADVPLTFEDGVWRGPKDDGLVTIVKTFTTLGYLRA